jgi:hypothetical protein
MNTIKTAICTFYLAEALQVKFSVPSTDDKKNEAWSKSGQMRAMLASSLKWQGADVASLNAS